LEEIFAEVPDMATRQRIGESVGAVLRSYLSAIERNREQAREGQETLETLEGQHPEFFRELLGYVKDARAWSRACRYFGELRQRKREEMKEKGLKMEEARRVLFAVQRAAMRRCREKVPGWSDIYPASEEDEKLAGQHEKMVEEFVAAVSGDERREPYEEDAFRRFASRNVLPSKLAEDAHHLARMIGLYHERVAPLSPELQAVLARRVKLGRRTVHAG
jgi:hypothetical protein